MPTAESRYLPCGYYIGFYIKAKLALISTKMVPTSSLGHPFMSGLSPRDFKFDFTISSNIIRINSIRNSTISTLGRSRSRNSTG